jgi:hypothetical protein
VNKTHPATDESSTYSQVADAGLQFLERVNLTGAEIPAFIAVRNMLVGIIDTSLDVVPVMDPPQKEK